MRRAWIGAAALSVLVIGLGGPRPVAADHCFGVTVDPSFGPPGTVFVIRQNGADPGIVTLFHDGAPVVRHRLDGWRDAVRFRTSSGDVGRWGVHLDIPHGDDPCGPNASFTVTDAPDTATVSATGGQAGPGGSADAGTARLLLLAIAAIAGAGIAARRSSTGPGRPAAT